MKSADASLRPALSQEPQVLRERVLERRERVQRAQRQELVQRAARVPPVEPLGERQLVAQEPRLAWEVEKRRLVQPRSSH